MGKLDRKLYVEREMLTLNIQKITLESLVSEDQMQMYAVGRYHIDRV